MDHKIIKRIYSMLLMLCTVFIATAQTNTFIVTGVVEDEYGDPLIGASVVVEGAQTGTITDFDGRFEINVPGANTIIVSYLGYSSQQFKITRSTALNVKLKEDTQMLGDIVVFGYGTMEKKDLTGSIQSLNSSDLIKSMATDVTEALNGRVSGVLVTKDSNRPGADMKIEIRGINSFNYSNEPLFVIDGVPSQSGMKHINSNDIESIDILKDASSCAIYGSRGANGVVIITTKGANKKQGFSVDYNGYVGIKTPTRIPDMIGNKGNGMDYVDYRTTLWKKIYGDASLNRSDFLTNDEKRRIKYGEYYDWLREISGESMVTSHSISSSGSSDKLSYSFGLGYLKDEGLVGKEAFDRITANVGLEYRFSDRFKMGMSSYISFNKTNHGSNDALVNAYFIPPIVGPYDTDGSYLFYCQPSSSKINPFIQIENDIRETEARYTNFAGFLEYSPIKDLAIKSQIAIQYDNDVYGEWIGSNTQSKQGVNDPEAFRKENVNMNYVWDNTATYNKTFNTIHRLNAVGLFSLQKDTHKKSEMRGTGFPYESKWHAMQNAEQLKDVESNYWESSMVSFMGRINYTLMDKYLFTVTGRYDGSSRLGSGNQWGFMPSFAIGWRMSEENFLQDVEWLSNLKPRVSWGKSGNNNIDYDLTYSKLALNRYTFGSTGQNGFGLGNRKGNKDLKWEMTSEWNFGLDLGLINNRISLTVDAYSRLTEDLIFARSVGSLNGYTSILENIGSTTNKGVELGLNTLNIQKKDFSWSTSATFSLNRNKIKELYGNGEDDLANRWFIGQPINVIYDYEFLGIWQEEESELAKKYGQVPGQIKVADRNDDDMIDERDYTIVGTPSPSWTLGMTNSFNYKNWDLSFYVYARIGGTYDDNFTYMFTGWDNEHWNKLDVNYWTPENRSNKYPQIGAQSYYTQVLSKVSGTFVKIQNITLGYTLPDNLMTKWKLKNARVYGTVQNPFTFTSYKGPDPETIGENVYEQLSLYPMTFTIGLSLSF